MSLSDSSEVIILPFSQMPPNSQYKTLYIPYIEVEGSPNKFVAGQILERLPFEGKKTFLDEFHNTMITSEQKFNENFVPFTSNVDKKIYEFTRNVRESISGLFNFNQTKPQQQEQKQEEVPIN